MVYITYTPPISLTCLRSAGMSTESMRSRSATMPLSSFRNSPMSSIYRAIIVHSFKAHHISIYIYTYIYTNIQHVYVVVAHLSQCGLERGHGREVAQGQVVAASAGHKLPDHI